MNVEVTETDTVPLTERQSLPIEVQYPTFHPSFLDDNSSTDLESRLDSEGHPATATNTLRSPSDTLPVEALPTFTLGPREPEEIGGFSFDFL